MGKVNQLIVTALILRKQYITVPVCAKGQNPLLEPLGSPESSHLISI